MAEEQCDMIDNANKFREKEMLKNVHNQKQIMEHSTLQVSLEINPFHKYLSLGT